MILIKPTKNQPSRLRLTSTCSNPAFLDTISPKSPSSSFLIFCRVHISIEGTLQVYQAPSLLTVRLNNIFTLCLPCQKWNYNFSHEDFIVYFPKSSHHNLLLQWGYDRGWSWPTKFTRPVILHFCTENSRRKVKRNWKSLKTANLI